MFRIELLTIMNGGSNSRVHILIRITTLNGIQILTMCFSCITKVTRVFPASPPPIGQRDGSIVRSTPAVLTEDLSSIPNAYTGYL